MIPLFALYIALAPKIGKLGEDFIWDIEPTLSRLPSIVYLRYMEGYINNILT
jgi:hypothetical protein